MGSEGNFEKNEQFSRSTFSLDIGICWLHFNILTSVSQVNIRWLSVSFLITMTYGLLSQNKEGRFCFHCTERPPLRFRIQINSRFYELLRNSSFSYPVAAKIFFRLALLKMVEVGFNFESGLRSAVLAVFLSSASRNIAPSMSWFSPLSGKNMWLLT